MVTIMDISSGERMSDVERYGDEVLNASWLPRPMLELGLQCASAAHHADPSVMSDPDGFMRRLYMMQE